MYHYLNLHPHQKLVPDCVKRSLTLLTGKDYREVSIDLNRLKRELGENKFNSKKVWKTYIKKMSWVKISFPAVSKTPRMSGAQFCLKYPKGKYLLSMPHHLTACVDGVIYDTWDCSEKCVYAAYRVSPGKIKIQPARLKGRWFTSELRTLCKRLKIDFDISWNETEKIQEVEIFAPRGKVFIDIHYVTCWNESDLRSYTDNLCDCDDPECEYCNEEQDS